MTIVINDISLFTNKRLITISNMNGNGRYLQREIAEVYRAEYSKVLATLIGLLGDFDRAEDAVQEAFTAALETWAKEGVPKNPRAWLISTGRFKGIDAIRRQKRGEELTRTAVREMGRDCFAFPAEDEITEGKMQDDQLRLIFTCCHPSIPLDSRIALSLREVCNLSTEAIARAYLVNIETMKKRISRAKSSIREKRIPFEIPSRSELRKRLDAVLHVVYLIYNEGFTASSGEQHIKTQLTSEAVLIARLLVDLLPEPEVIGLLSLLLFHESRSATRIDGLGDLIPLEYQDRSRWDRSLMDEGTLLVQRAFLSGQLGLYSMQAAIASVHAAASSIENTNWAVIVSYYDLMLQIGESPVVMLNRAIAVGMRDGPDKGLELISPLIINGPLARYHYAHAAYADFARRAGHASEAFDAYSRALELTNQRVERRYLEKQISNFSKDFRKAVPPAPTRSTTR